MLQLRLPSVFGSSKLPAKLFEDVLTYFPIQTIFSLLTSTPLLMFTLLYLYFLFCVSVRHSEILCKLDHCSCSALA